QERAAARWPVRAFRIRLAALQPDRALRAALWSVRRAARRYGTVVALRPVRAPKTPAARYRPARALPSRGVARRRSVRYSPVVQKPDKWQAYCTIIRTEGRIRPSLSDVFSFFEGLELTSSSQTRPAVSIPRSMPSSPKWYGMRLSMPLAMSRAALRRERMAGPLHAGGKFDLAMALRAGARVPPRATLET